MSKESGMLEREVRRAAEAILAKYPVYSFCPVTGGYGQSGVFDQVLCVSGLFIGIEYKRDSRHKPTTLQGLNAQRCRMDGKGIALLIHNENLSDLDVIIKTISEAATPTVAANRVEALCGLFPGTFLWKGKKVTSL